MDSTALVERSRSILSMVSMRASVCAGMSAACSSSVCPSGLRGYVQVVMFSNAWVQIPQLTWPLASALNKAPSLFFNTSRVDFWIDSRPFASYHDPATALSESGSNKSGPESLPFGHDTSAASSLKIVAAVDCRYIQDLCGTQQ